jgi:hypothetical protein
MSYAFLENEDGGTHIEIRLAKAKPKDTVFLEHVVEEFRKNITNEIATLRQLLEGSQRDDGIEELKLAVLAERIPVPTADRA